MIVAIIQLIAIFAVPLLIFRRRNGKLTRLFGPIGMAYFYGIVVALAVYVINLCGGDFHLNSDVGEIGSYAAIGVAIPLLLFSSNLGQIKRLTRTVLLSFGSLTLSVMVVSFLASHLYGRSFESGRQLCAMAIGLYTGGTPNFNAIGVILGVPGETIALGNLSDMIIGGVFYVFILLLAKPLLSKLLKTPSKELYLREGSGVDNIDDIHAFRLHRAIVRNILLALLCAVLGAGVGVLLWMANGSVQGTLTDNLVPGIMVTGTLLGIGLSFVNKIRDVPENTSVGQYLILVFSFALASCLDLSQLSVSFLSMLLLLGAITVLTFVVHVIISKLLKIDADCTIVTMTAGIYGPAFVPAVTAQLKNERLTAPGLICGAIGYAVGTFLGVGLYYIL